MVQSCRTCQRTNPRDATYCYNDGTRLEGARGGFQPPPVGRFAQPFVFGRGQQCNSYAELANAACENWGEARQFLQRGVFQQFLNGMGRADLARAASEAARFPDPDIGLDQFLAALPGEALSAAKLEVTPLEVNLGQLNVGQDSRFHLQLRNGGSRLVHGSVRAEEPWLVVGTTGQTSKLFRFSQQEALTVQVQGSRLRAGNKALEGKLFFESSGGSQVVTVRVEVPVKPFAGGVFAGARTPRDVAQKAREQPREAIPLFETGAVSRWYQENGWAYPVQGPTAAGPAALQQFFEALGLAKAPAVEISDRSLNLQATAGGQLESALEVRTAEKRPVYASAISDQPWLRIGPVNAQGSTARIPLSIPSVPADQGPRLTAQVTVTANGNQRFVVPVTVTVAGARAPAPPPWDPTRSTSANAMPTVPAPAWLPTTPASPPAPPPVLPASTAAASPPWLQPQPAAPQLTPAAPPAWLQPQPGPPVLPVPPAAPPPVLGGNMLPAPQLQGVTPGAPPVLTPTPAAEAPTLSAPPANPAGMLIHLAPVALLGLVLLGFVVWDWLSAGREPGEGDQTIQVDKTPRVAVWFHDKLTKDEVANRLLPPPTMRFGITDDPPTKRLTFNLRGLSNNTCLKINGKEVLFGDSNEGSFEGKGVPDGKAARWRPNDTDLVVTQKVEVVPGQVRRRGDKLVQWTDTVLVRYEITNNGVAREVGLRFLLDTYIGSNDGVPFYMPGEKSGILTRRDYPKDGKVPDYVFALEKNDPKEPGTVCRVALNYPKLEKPNRLVLSAWPRTVFKHPKYAKGGEGGERAEGLKTMWDAPLFDITAWKDTKGNGDSAVWMYWDPKTLGKGETRTVGFAYGLADIKDDEASGNLLVSAPQATERGKEFDIQVLISNPQRGQTITIELPANLRLVGGTATQNVPEVGAGEKSSVTWRVVSTQVGKAPFTVKLSTGESRRRTVNILTIGIW